MCEVNNEIDLRVSEHGLGSSGSGYGPATGSSESTNVVTGSVKGTWGWLRQHRLSKEESAHQVERNADKTKYMVMPRAQTTWKTQA